MLQVITFFFLKATLIWLKLYLIRAAKVKAQKISIHCLETAIKSRDLLKFLLSLKFWLHWECMAKSDYFHV